MAILREHLSAPGLLRSVRGAFKRVRDHRAEARIDVPLPDALMSGIALFGMKYASLLAFDKDRFDPVIADNLTNLYGVEQPPCDTQMREILDLVDPKALRPAYKAVFAKLQDGKALAPYRFVDDSYLVSLDGTGYFSSHKVHCDNCCVKQSKSGAITYYHQMLGAVIVHPDLKQVIPLAPEPILKQDGSTKNDCEMNAVKRLLPGLRTDHPFLKITLLGDSLFSKAPIIELAKSLNMGFIFNAKPGDHKSLFLAFEDAESIGAVAQVNMIDGDIERSFRFINSLPLNDSNPDILVNFLLYTESKRGKSTTFSWVTDIELTSTNVFEIMKGGRSRWHIENETFNTLKNQGYQFDHNFGHGYKNLSTVLAFLMMLAFLVDQAQELCCPVFKEIAALAGQRKYLWEKIRSFFFVNVLDSWENLFETLLQRLRARLARLKPNTC